MGLEEALGDGGGKAFVTGAVVPHQTHQKPI